MTKTFLDFQAQLVELKQSLKEGKQKDEIANVTGPAVAGTGDDSSVVVERRKERRCYLMWHLKLLICLEEVKLNMKSGLSI